MSSRSASTIRPSRWPPATRERSPRDYTPKHLAEKILTSRSALEGELKQVTVLFADVKGSMEIAEQLDPEVWSAIMQRFFTIFADGVERFEGRAPPPRRAPALHRDRRHRPRAASGREAGQLTLDRPRRLTS